MIEPPIQVEQRPWGSFKVLQDLPYCKLKQLIVLPDNQLSLQSHQRREEHWIVVRGTPEVTVGEKVWQAHVGEYIFIPKTTRHRLANRTQEAVEIVEVQLGDYFGEDDIVRFQDDYQRV